MNRRLVGGRSAVLLTFLLFLSAGWSHGFTLHCSAPPAKSQMTRSEGWVVVGSPLFAEKDASSPDSEEKKEEEPSEEKESSSAPASEEQTPRPIPPPSPAQPQLQPIPASQKQLDPLVRSLTRMDAETANAPTTKIPFLGELVLDQSLFLLVPVAAFAVIGFLLSIFIALNATDAFVELEAAATVGKQATPVELDGSCRGLCSSQQEDLEGLRVFMSNFGKN